LANQCKVITSKVVWLPRWQMVKTKKDIYKKHKKFQRSLCGS